MGVLVAIQSRINASLSIEVGGGVIAAAVSFGTGLLLAVVIVATRPAMRQSLRSLPDLVRSGRLRWWQLLGGIGGAWLVTTQGIVVVVVGVTIFTVGVVAGQVGGSLAADRLGLSPAGQLGVTTRRGLAAIVALVAVMVATARSGGAQVAFSWVVLLAVSAGVGISLQQAINGRVSTATGQPMAATVVNFVVGFSGLLAVAVGAWATGTLTFSGWPTQWWLYLGGPIGVLFIALAAWAVRGLGVLVFGLITIAGQLTGSVLVDLATLGPTVLGALQWVGLVLIAIAVVLAAVPDRGRWSGRMAR